MIYLDTSVALAHLLGEDEGPPAELWNARLVSSRLLEYEVFTRVNSRRLAGSHSDLARALLDRVAMVELSPVVLARALEPFPAPVRTFDALHLATADFLRSHGQAMQLATYDLKMADVATRMGMPLFGR